MHDLSEARSELLERDDDLERLGEQLERARAGQGNLVLIEGAPGIGKTGLLRALRYGAEADGMQVATARGGELERDFAFGVVRQLYAGLAAKARSNGDSGLLDGVSDAALRALGLDAAVDEELGDDASFPVFQGLYWLTSNLCETAGPLLISVDDAHWADDPSLRYLAFFANRLEDLPVLVAVTARPRAQTEQIDPLDRLRTDPATTVVEPRALSEDAVEQIVREALGPEAAPEFCTACHRASRGNPFLLRQLVSELDHEGVAPTAQAAGVVGDLAPRTVTRSVLVRLARLPAGARALAQAVAVLGDRTDFVLAQQVAELDRAAGAEAADRLAAADILAPGRPLAFVHPLVRQAIYNDLPAGTRSHLHDRSARLLRERGAQPSQVAVHLLASDPGGQPGAAELLREAANEALRVGAVQTALSCLTRALEEPVETVRRAQLLRDLVDCEVRAGFPGATEHAREALELDPDPRHRARVARLLGTALLGTGHPAEAVVELEEAIQAVLPHDREAALSLVADLTAWLRLDPTTARSAAARVDAWEDQIRPGRTPAERALLANLAFRLAERGRPADEVADAAARALGDGVLIREQGSESVPVYHAINALQYAGRLNDADRMVEMAQAAARRQGSAVGLAAATVCGIGSIYQRGDATQVETAAHGVLELATEGGWVPAVGSAVGFQVWALLERGEVEEAERVVAAHGFEEDVPENYYWSPHVLAARGKLALAQLRLRDAARDMLRAAELMEEARGRSLSGIWGWRSGAALALAGLGEETAAREHAEAELQSNRAWGVPHLSAASLRVCALVGPVERRAESLRAAAAELEGTPARLELARVQVDLGATLRRANRRSEARAPLREGLEAARRCGAVALAKRAHEELEASGERVRRFVPRGLDSLTPSERRVADLAARGLSNRDIAQSLFVSLKTVEKHLSSTYRKLDVSQRQDLAAALGD